MIDQSDPSEADLYAADLSVWTEEQAGILQHGRWDQLDGRHLAGVIDALGSRELCELQDRIGIIITGMLRWSEQVDLRCHGWAVSIDMQRHLVGRVLRDSPSLGDCVPELVAEAYETAKSRAILESGLLDSSFSSSCPFSEAEILTDGYYPDPYGDDVVRGEGWWKCR